MDLDELISENISDHFPYVPGIQPSEAKKVVKLNTNENPYPPSPLISHGIIDQINNLRFYPDSSSLKLRQSIARLHDVHPDQVIVGNGSDDILNLCVRCFSDKTKPVGFYEPSYSLYKVLASLNGSKTCRVSFKDEMFQIDPDSIIQKDTNIFFITTPHAPSGRTYENSIFSAILEKYSGILVLDEAYADFAKNNALELLDRSSRLIITRTLSKSYSLAGLRVGYGVSSKEIISVLNQAREVYNIDRLAQYIAETSLKDRDYFSNNLSKIIKNREKLFLTLQNWGWKTYESGANFLFTRPVDSFGNYGASIAKKAFEFLRENQIFIRYFPEHDLTSSYLRISIGKQEELDMLTECLQKWQTIDQRV